MAAYKILHVINYLIPDSGYQENKLLKEFSSFDDAKYFFVSVAKNYPIDGGYEYLADIFEERDIKPGFNEEACVGSYRLEPKFERRQRIWLKGLYDVINDIKPDAIVVHGAANLNTLRVAIHKRFFSDKKYRLIVDDHIAPNLINTSLSAKLFYFIYRKFFARFLSSQTNIFIPVTASVKNVMTQIYGLSGDFKVIELGADQNIFYPCEELRRKFRSEHKIDDKEFVLAYTGKIIEEKKVHLLIEAFFELHSAYPELKLFIIGFADPSYIKRIRNQCLVYQIDSSVIFADAVKNSALSEVYNGVDLVVWPDGVSMSSLEAAMCGLPAVMRNLDANAERLRDGSAASGLLFDKDEDMIECIRILISDLELRKGLSKECLKLTDKRSWSAKALEFHKASIG
jgi:glycosyltransferase involved in cell wall biosynthesis